MSKLYDITGDILTLQAMLEEGIEDEQVLSDTLEAVQGEYEYKLESYCKIIRNLEADIDALKSEAERLNGKRAVLMGSVDRLKKAMFESMKATNTPKVKGTLFTVAIQKNGGKTPIIVDPNIDTSKLPDELVIISEKPDLERIREQLEAGKVIDGFKLGERGESLRIR